MVTVQCPPLPAARMQRVRDRSAAQQLAQDRSGSLMVTRGLVDAQLHAVSLAPRCENSTVSKRRGWQTPTMEESRSAEFVLEPTPRTKVRRKAERGRYDWGTVAATLDAGTVAHVGFVGAEGVCVLPMVYGRVGDHLYLHGASGNAMLRRLADGGDVCVTVTIVDALVLSRSAFHHSMNYRSVTVVGQAVLVDDHGREAPRAARRRRPQPAGPVRRLSRTERFRAAHDSGDPAPDHRGVGEGPHRAADRGARRSRDCRTGVARCRWC